MAQSKKARSTESVVAMLARMEKELKALSNIPKLSANRTPYSAMANKGMTDPLQSFTDTERMAKEYGYSGVVNNKLSMPTAAVFKPMRVSRYDKGGNVKTTEQMKQELRRFKNGGSNVVTNQPGYLESTPTKPNPLVGTRYKTKTVGRSLKENPYDIAQAKDAVIVGAPWDATSRGEQVTEVSGNPIKRKIVTSGGQGYADGGEVTQDAMEAALALRKPKKMFTTIDEAAGALKRSKGTGAEFLSEAMKHPSAAREMTARGLKEIGAMPQMTKDEFMQHLKDRPVNKINQFDQDEPMHRKDQLPGGKNYREMLLQLGGHKGQTFTHSSHHGDVPNVLAHMRVSDRTGPNGEKIMHAEEIQSDWHQQGSKHGYKSEESARAKKLAELKLRDIQDKRADSKMYMVEQEKRMAKPEFADLPVQRQQELKSNYTFHRDRYLDLLPAQMKAEAALQDLPESNPKAVPDAPFKK